MGRYYKLFDHLVLNHFRLIITYIIRYNLPNLRGKNYYEPCSLEITYNLIIELRLFTIKNIFIHNINEK